MDDVISIHVRVCRGEFFSLRFCLVVVILSDYRVVFSRVVVMDVLNYYFTRNNFDTFEKKSEGTGGMLLESVRRVEGIL